jgi:signal transduction histidine kinase
MCAICSIAALSSCCVLLFAVKYAKSYHIIAQPRLSEDILDVSRIEGKAFKLNKEMVNLKDIVLTVDLRAHGGKIWAENNKHGKGATFSFSLPLIN